MVTNVGANFINHGLFMMGHTVQNIVVKNDRERLIVFLSEILGHRYQLCCSFALAADLPPRTGRMLMFKVDELL